MGLFKKVASALVVAASLLTAQAAFAQQKASIRLDWVPGGDHAFLYYGKEKGIFSAEGIDLEILPGQGSPLSVRLVGNGDNDFGLADANTVSRAWEAGVPIKVLHVMWQETPVIVMARQDAGIQKLEDICGKKVGVSIQSTTYAMMKAMFRAAGVTCAYEEIPVSGGGVSDFVAGTVVGLHGFTHMFPVFARARGVEVVEFHAADYFKNLYSMTLITNAATLENGDLAKRFTRAALKSLDEALANPEEAVAAFSRANKEVNAADTKAQMPILARLQTVDAGGKRVVGRQTAEGWNNTIKVLLQAGIIKRPIDPTGRFVNLVEQ